MMPVPRLTGAVGILLLAAAGAAAIGLDERRSGIDFASPETQAMQADDMANPGMFWVLEGEQLWSETRGAANRSCQECHGAAAVSMRGVAARYPAFDEASGQPLDLAGRINACGTRHQQAEPLARESRPLLALSAFVAHQSRGMPVAPDTDPRLEPYRIKGAQLFEQRMGQLDLSCANCHQDHWNARLGGSAVTQAQPNGYPLYRLEWQALGSLQRRLRACMVGIRAEPFEFGSQEFIDLELHLMQRAKGLPLETPGVRP